MTNPFYIRPCATPQAEEEEATAQRSPEDLATVEVGAVVAAVARTEEEANPEAAAEEAEVTTVALRAHLSTTMGPRHADSSIQAQRKMEWISLHSRPRRLGTKVRVATVAAGAGAGVRSTRTQGRRPRP